MSGPTLEVWKWMKTAPLPVVLAIVLVSGAVCLRFSLAADSKASEAKATAEHAEQRVEDVKETVDKMDDKLDRLLEAVLDIKAEQKAKKSKDEEE